MQERVVDFTNVEDFSADGSIADRLHVEPDDVTAIAVRLWGHSATKERDERLSAHADKTPKELRTLRAGMTKRLIREIKPHIEEAADN